MSSKPRRDSFLRPVHGRRLPSVSICSPATTRRALPSSRLDAEDRRRIVGALDRIGWAPRIVKDALRMHGVDVTRWRDREVATSQ